MKNKKLFLLCGPAGSGKTTWIKKQIEMVNYPCLHIYRDAVRMEFLKEEDKNKDISFLFRDSHDPPPRN